MTHRKLFLTKKPLVIKKGSHTPTQMAIGFFVGKNPDIKKNWLYKMWKKVTV